MSPPAPGLCPRPPAPHPLGLASQTGAKAAPGQLHPLTPLPEGVPQSGTAHGQPLQIGFLRLLLHMLGAAGPHPQPVLLAIPLSITAPLRAADLSLAFPLPQPSPPY